MSSNIAVSVLTAKCVATTLVADIFIITFLCFSTGPDEVGRWQTATFFLFFQGTSIGLARTNQALLSLADTNLRSYYACVPATDKAVLCTLKTVELAMGIEQNFGTSVDTAVVAMTYFKH